jgi:hypothetical protein
MLADAIGKRTFEDAVIEQLAASMQRIGAQLRRRQPTAHIEHWGAPQAWRTSGPGAPLVLGKAHHMMRSLVPGSGKGERKDDAHEEENITPAHLGHR